MKTFGLKLQDGFPKTKMAIGSLCFAGYLALVLLSGGSLLGLALFWFWLLFCIYLPGRFFSLLLRAQKWVPEATTPLAILYGTGFFAVCTCVMIRFELERFLFLPMFLVSAAALYCTREQAMPLHIVREKWKDSAFLSRFALWGFLCLMFGFCISVKNAHPGVVGSLIPNPDLLWNIGNANSFAIAFPPQDIRFSMVRLSYHYLTELIGGALAIVSGIPAYDIFAFYYGPAVLLALLCCLYALGLGFYAGHKGKALLLTFSMFLFNCASLWTALYSGRGVFWNSNLLHLVTNINSQATAILFASIFLLLFLSFARRGFAVPWLMIATFVCSMVLLCFAKGPAAAIIACSFAITMVFVLCRKPNYLKALAALVGVLAVFALIYFVVFASGANTSVRFGNKTLEASVFDDLLHAIWLRNVYLWKAALVVAAIANFFCMQPVQMLLWGKALFRDLRRFWKLPAERLLAYGVVVGGVMAYHLFWHPSMSQSYFAYIAIFFVNLLAVDEIDRLGKGAFRKLAAFCAAIGLATSAVMYINFTGSGARQLLRNYDIIAKYPYEVVLTAEDEEALRWLRAHSDKADAFATNRIHCSRTVTDGISNCYTAISGRQAYMEGYTYATTNMGVSEAVVQEKQATNAALFSAATPPEEILRLCTENSIRYLVYSTQFYGDVAQLAEFERIFANDSVTIYEIPLASD